VRESVKKLGKVQLRRRHVQVRLSNHKGTIGSVYYYSACRVRLASTCVNF
jgi:hypothetical protein